MEGTANSLVPLTFLAWFPITAALFLYLPARRAVLVSVLSACVIQMIMENEIKLIAKI